MDRRGSGFKKILGDYRNQIRYTECMEPEFNSDNDSFLLVLKNLNYQNIKTAIKIEIKKSLKKHCNSMI